jgi:hypothetical protein
MTDRKKPGVAFWATVVVVAVLLYPISFGPACWITSRTNMGASAIPAVYRPLTWAMSPNSETMINRVSTWYAKIGAAENWEWGSVWDPDAGRHDGWWWGSTDFSATPPPSYATP